MNKDKNPWDDKAKLGFFLALLIVYLILLIGGLCWGTPSHLKMRPSTFWDGAYSLTVFFIVAFFNGAVPVEVAIVISIVFYLFMVIPLMTMVLQAIRFVITRFTARSMTARNTDANQGKNKKSLYVVVIRASEEVQIQTCHRHKPIQTIHKIKLYV